MIIRYLKFFYRLLITVGLDPRNLNNLKYIFNYLKGEREWRKQGGLINKRLIILKDFDGDAGSSKSEYFHQDLLVANLIYKNNPKRHLDVGSRIDGFVSHVASFRKIEVIDIRPLENSAHNNINFIQADLMNPINIKKTDSLSCLHAIEHFGLGRYKDPININGHIKGIDNLISLLKKDGTFYISFPIGLEDKVYYNAHRIFHPRSILNFPNVKKYLSLSRFDYIDTGGSLHSNVQIEETYGKHDLSCGIYTFKKILE